MKINTTRFGSVEIEDDKIIMFDEGLPGFEDLHRFVLLTPEDIAPFCWLQSADDPDIAFVVAEPSSFISGYEPEFPDEALQAIEIDESTECLILSVIVVPHDFKQATANLAAPILINVGKRKAMQVVLNTGLYMVRHKIFDRSSHGRTKQCSY